MGGEPHLPFLLDELRLGGLPPASAKALAAIMRGSVPTPAWLSRHGWQIEGRCPYCDQDDDLEHLLHGCFVRGPAAHGQAQDEWKKAIAGNG